ncbi:MAG: hypothetical protein CME06_10965, partial [Gemmatimonadetes bacterium]|nr:hypothetical protein [Gemmatimonadota bacterium]
LTGFEVTVPTEITEALLGEAETALAAMAKVRAEGRYIAGLDRMEARILSAMAEELPILHITRVLPPDRGLSEEWAAAAPPGMILARAVEVDAAGGVAVHYLTIPHSPDPYTATTATGGRTRTLRYMRRLKSGADPSQIRLRITPADEAALRAATEKGEEIWIVSVDHSVEDPIREGRSRHVFEALRELGEIHQAAPPLAELRAGESHGAFRLVMGVREGAAPIRDLLEKIAGDAEWAVRPFVFTSGDIEQPRGAALTGGRSSVLVDRATLHELTTHASALVDRVQEMQEADTNGARALIPLREALSGAIEELLNVPAERLFAGIDRLALDVSKRRGRSVRTLTEIEPGSRIPRWIAESLRDSILHLVRNAVDHGIEAAADRVGIGKPPVGTLRLAFRRTGSDWVLEVEDDGAGIDAQALRAKLPESDSVPMEELIFTSGVTSRAEADDISGRGLGLGIVKDAVEACRGRIDIRTFPGEGTSFRIELPDRSEEIV